MARVRWDETFAKPKDWTSQLVPTSDSKVLDTIRWMFHFYAETDESLNSVTKSLNDRGIPTSEGKSWRTGTVKRMLSNPVYIGVARFGVEKSGSFFQMAPNGEIETGNGDHENGSRSYSYDSPALQFENAHEPIIEKDTFEAVQAKLQRRKTFPSRRGQRSRSYPLTGILRCGACGGSLSGHTATIRDKGAVKNHIRYYTCSGSKAHLCVEWCLRSEEIEKLMTEFAVEHLESQIELLTQAIEQEVTNRKQKKPTKKNHLRKELDALTLKIDRGVEAILEADKNHIPELSRKLQQWKDRRDELQRELNNQPPKEKDESINPKAVIAKFRNLAATIKKASPVDAREFYCQVFDHIDIFWNDSAPRGRKFDRGIVFFG